MTFPDYIQLITKSVCETGFDAFLPSLCIVDGDEIIMKVLDAEPSDGGDEELAMNWLGQFVRDGRTVFVAYRSGSGIISIMEVVGFDATRKHTLRVAPE